MCDKYKKVSHIMKYNDIFSDEQKEQIINDYVLNYLSIRELQTKYNIKSRSWLSSLLKGKTRNISEANVVAHSKYPEKYKHSDKTRAIMREKRLAYMKSNPNFTAWRQRQQPSYPEKCFIEYLTDRKLDKKYLIEREKSVFPYFIDFAIESEMLAIEIDGSQHITDVDCVSRDIKKTELLISKGWKVLRISEDAVKHDWESIDLALEKVITSDIKNSKVGLFKAPKTRKKAERLENGYTQKQLEFYYKARKVKDRPTKEQLDEMLKTMSRCEIGRMYNVSEASVRNWIKGYKHMN